VGPSAPTEQPKRRRKGPKGPNPLSVKKMKTQPAAAPQVKGNTRSDTVLAGMKRRVEDDSNDQESSDSAGVHNAGPPAKKKRKRRKKNN